MAADCGDAPRLSELLAGLTEGLLTRAEEEELTGLLNADDAARAFYRNYMAIDGSSGGNMRCPRRRSPRKLPPPFSASSAMWLTARLAISRRAGRWRI